MKISTNSGTTRVNYWILAQIIQHYIQYRATPFLSHSANRGTERIRQLIRIPHNPRESSARRGRNPRIIRRWFK
jgi:hypothetical protein